MGRGYLSYVKILKGVTEAEARAEYDRVTDYLRRAQDGAHRYPIKEVGVMLHNLSEDKALEGGQLEGGTVHALMKWRLLDDAASVPSSALTKADVLVDALRRAGFENPKEAPKGVSFGFKKWAEHQYPRRDERYAYAWETMDRAGCRVQIHLIEGQYAPPTMISDGYIRYHKKGRWLTGDPNQAIERTLSVIRAWFETATPPAG